MKVLSLFAVAALALTAATGCSTIGKVASIPGASVNFKPLERDQYVILGSAKGEACAEETCWFGSCSKKSSIPGEENFEGRIFSTGVQNGTQVASSGNPLLDLFFGTGQGGPTGSELAENIATYKAIESMPDADAVIVPRKTIDVTSSNFLIGSSTKSCVKLMGKAIRLKADTELTPENLKHSAN